MEEYPFALLIANNDGDLPMHIAVGGNVPSEAVCWLLERYKIAFQAGYLSRPVLQIPNLRGDWPLHVACREHAPRETVCLAAANKRMHPTLPLFRPRKQ